MEREQVLLSLLWIPALPLLAAAFGRLLEPRLRRDPARYGARALQLAAGSTALTALLTASALRQLLRGDAPRIVEGLWSWITIGTTTTLRAELVLDPLSGAVLVGLLLLTFLAQLVAQGRPRQLLITSAALGGGLLLALGKSLGIIALGWHVLGIAALFAGEGPTRRRLRALALADGALWLSFGAATYAAGAPDVGQILRTTLQGTESRFGTLEIAGLPLAALAGAALIVAIVARGVGAARGQGEPRRDRGPLEALLAGPLTLLPAAYLLLRLSPIVAMDAALLPAVAAGGALLVLVASARALAAPCPRETLVEVGLAEVGLVVVAVGVRAWLPALVLAAIAAATQLGLRVVEASIDAPGETHRPWTRLGAALCGLAATPATPLGLLPPLGVVAAAAWTLGGAGPALAILVIAAAGALSFAVARALRRLFADAPGRPREEPTVALVATCLGAVGLGLGALSLPMIPRLPGLAAGGRWLEPLLRPALRQAEQLAPLAPPPSATLSALLGALLLVAWVGIALGRRAPAAADTGGDPVARVVAPLRPLFTLGAAAVAAPGALLDHAERLLAALRQWVARRIWLADGRPGVRVVVMLLAGVGLTLAPVYCNPDIVVLGPTGVHPVDLGGLDPLISAPKKTREEKLRSLERPKTRLAPPDPEAMLKPHRTEDVPR